MKGNIVRAFLSIFLLLVCSGVSQAQERIRYFINDPSGNPVQVLDADGAVVARYAYAPFGAQVAAQGAANQRLGFVGGVKETGSLHYLKHRYYNPLLGRFYQPDPVGFLAGGATQINRYGYGLNDPYTYQDKDGRCLPVCAALIPLAIWALDNMRSDAPNMANTPPSGVGDAAVMGYAIGGIAASATMARWAAAGAAMDYNALVATANAAKVANTAGSIRSVNAVGGTMNCVNCVIATDATLAGRAASAMPGGPYRISVLESLYGARFGAAGPIENVSTAMSAAGSGARGIVFGSRGNEVGHVFNTVNQNGVIQFLDGQTGRAASLDGYKSFQLLRTN